MILVTGSAGHLGEGLMRRLRAEGRPALGLDLKPSPFTDRVGSIGERDFVRSCLGGIRAVVHAATLHKPHVATHTAADFLATNVAGTLVLLEEAVAAGVESFVFTSTTSAFGAANRPAAGAPAAWITEDVAPIPRNIYGTSKVMAESLCELAFRRDRMPAIVLRTSRFFPEPDDDADVRARYALENAQVNELLNRRVDLADVVDAHLLALAKSGSIGFGRYIISATTPFAPGDLAALRQNPAAIVHRFFPDCAAVYDARQWTLPSGIDRVYVNHRAVAELGWRPSYDFRGALASLAVGEDFRSPLARAVGSKGYHATAFGDAPYPVRRV